MFNTKSVNCTDLIKHYLLTLGSESAIFRAIGQLIHISVMRSAVEGKPRNRNNITHERWNSEIIEFGFAVTVEGNIWSIDTAIVDIHRITEFLLWNTALSNILVLNVTILEKRYAKI
jgi:hypothetical protein